MRRRTLLNAAAQPMAGALLGWLAPSVRLASPVQAEDKPAASAELDRTVRQLFALANGHMRRELNDLARRLDRLTVPRCDGSVGMPIASPDLGPFLRGTATM